MYDKPCKVTQMVIYQYSEFMNQTLSCNCGYVVKTTKRRRKPTGHFWNENHQTRQSLIYLIGNQKYKIIQGHAV